MKYSIFTLISLISISLSLVTLNSCKEPCEDYCVNGYCLSGECDCKLGWMGDACDEVDPTYVPNDTKGYASFFQKDDINCGSVQVDISQDGEIVSSASITQFHTEGINDCDESGAANFTLDIGAYAYFAEDTCGTTWTDSITIATKYCDRIILN